MSLVKTYLELFESYKKEYGPKSVVLMQVGAFFEVYGLKNSTGETIRTNIDEFARLCDLVVANKRTCVGSDDVVMAGFRDYMLDKYLAKLRAEGYTVAVYTQDTPSKNTTRSLSGIYSPGTSFTNDTEVVSNNLMSIWAETLSKQIVIGIANVDVLTGKTMCFELAIPNIHDVANYDEIERFITSYSPSEILIIGNDSHQKLHQISEFIGASGRCVRVINTSESDSKLSKIARAAERQTYQKEVLKRFDIANSQSTLYTVFCDNTLACQSFCFLLDYVYSHNPNLVSRLHPPTFDNPSSRMTLANHTLRQLNIVDDQQYRGKLSSVLSLLNNCITSTGKRRFRTSLLSPSRNIDSLNISYKTIDCFSKLIDVDSIRSKLANVKDIERLERKRLLKRTTPSDFAAIFSSLEATITLIETLRESPDISLFAETAGYNFTMLTDWASSIIALLEKTFDMEMCKQINTLSFTRKDDDTESEDLCFVKRGVSKEIDSELCSDVECRDRLEAIRAYLNSIVAKAEKKSGSKTDFIKSHETPTMGISLICTKRREQLLFHEIKKIKDQIVYVEFKSRFDGQNKTFSLDLNGITSRQQTGSNMEIISTEITALENQIRTAKIRLSDTISTFYASFIESFDENNAKLNSIATFIGWTDYFTCLAYNAVKYNYTCPIIDTETDSTSAFFEAKELRHCLIERLLEDEVYVSNNLSLKDEHRGVLLYGTNAVGKTSFIRAIGIAVVLAQSGMYVPASYFRYSPFSGIYTRIIGNDNLFRGMSTFAVEMSEFRTVLENADSDSLILGDELCSGTESDSALSIFTAGVEHMSANGSAFIFATHFHELAKYEEISSIKTLHMYHMGVEYDKSNDRLIYDRVLRHGTGESMYGLEVCKALKLPQTFLNRAHEIRSKYNKERSTVSEFTKSRYNQKKLMGKCELCKINRAEDTHHLQYQQDADSKGFIGGFHKDHSGNLAALCKKCHTQIHKDNLRLIRKMTSDGYILVAIEETQSLETK